MEIEFEDQAKELIKRAKGSGAYEAEAYFIDNKTIEVKVFKQKLDSIKMAKISGVGLRVIMKGKSGYAYSSQLTQEALDQLVVEAVENAKNCSSDPYVALPEPSSSNSSLSLYNPKLTLTPTPKKIGIAMASEKAALEYDPRIKGSEYVVYADSERFIYLANSKGFSSGYKATDCYLYLSVIAEEKGKAQTGKAFAVGRATQALKHKETGKQAAEKAISLLGASPIDSTEAAIIFDSLAAAELISVVGMALSAEAVQKGRSLFAGKIGEKVASETITLVDDGTLKEGIASSPFDGEGVPTQRTTLIAGGILQGFLHNTYTAKKDKVNSTGNAARLSYKSPPEVLPSNLFLLPGKIKRDELLAQTKRGFYVMELQGLHSGANPITGEFSVGAVGHWIEKGIVTQAVGEVTIAGNILNMLERIDLVADDLEFIPMGASFGSPTLRVQCMAISGK